MSNEKEDDENCLYFGTPLEEAESFLLSRKQPLTNRAPRVWEQIVTDERGRRRLHGAFTGGFSAGYFNTVDTKEGFTPKTFKTSRSHRAEGHKQAVHDFYDKDELEELQRVNIVAQDAYDTFSSVANEKIKERTEQEVAARPIIPGGLINEFIESVPDSIGVKLLQRMGWRQGKGIGEAFKSATETEIELGWGPEASVQQEEVKIWNQKPKMNLHGLGFDPFRGSEDFRRLKSQNSKSEKQPTKRSRGIAFGVGVLEETDTFGEMADYVDTTIRDRINYYDMSEESDDDKKLKKPSEDLKRIKNKPRSLKAGDESFVPGYCLSTMLKEQKSFPLPVVPPNFTGKLQVVEQENTISQEKNAKLTVPAPQVPLDHDKKRLIDSVAVFVAKGGYLSEELVREEHKQDVQYSFLFSGEGSEYYRWKLLDVKVTFQKLGVQCIGQREAPLTADDRGFLLGDEKLKEDFKSASSSRAVSHPNLQGVPETDRNRVKMALKSTFVRGSQETALQEQEVHVGLRGPKPKAQEEEKNKDMVKSQRKEDSCVPVRWFIEWHPTPLLYKRFNILDPFKGQVQEAETKSKFMSYEAQMDDIKDDQVQSSVNAAPVISIADQVDITLPPPDYTEPPLDIFKSIFDASDDETEETEEAEQAQVTVPTAQESHPEPVNNEGSATSAKIPNQRKKLKVSSDESSEDENPQRAKTEHQGEEGSSSESFDESMLSGLTTSEFKKLLRTLKKGHRKKSSSRKKHKKEKKRKKERHKMKKV